jgi:hypothetical protein
MTTSVRPKHKETDMRKILVATLIAGAATPAFADSGEDSVRAGAEMIESGAHLAGAGSAELLTGDSIPGAASVALGSVAMALGGTEVAIGSAALGVETTAQEADRAIDQLFTEPVRVSDATIIAQPAPDVPREAQLANKEVGQ